jgi:hypothetical protein
MHAHPLDRDGFNRCQGLIGQGFVPSMVEKLADFFEGWVKQHDLMCVFVLCYVDGLIVTCSGFVGA